jgi:DNA mismatch repair protein MutL
VKKALQTHHVSNTLDFTEDTNFSPAQFIQQAYTETYQTANKTDYKADKIFNPPSPTTRDKNNLQNWDKMYAQWQQEVPETNKPLEGQKFSSSANVAQLFETDVSSENRSAILLQQRYLVTPAKSGLMIIDYQAAMQRIWFDRLQDARKKNQPRSQQILFPTVVEINQADWVLLAEMEEELRALGLNFEALGQGKIKITGLPSEWADEPADELLQELISQYSTQAPALAWERFDVLAKALAKRKAWRTPQMIETKELNLLIDKLFASSNPNYTPDGDVIVKVWGIKSIEQFFRGNY